MKSILIILLVGIAAVHFCNAQVPQNDQTWDLVFSETFDDNLSGTTSKSDQKLILQNHGWHFGWVPPSAYIDMVNSNPTWANYFTQNMENIVMTTDGTLKMQIIHHSPPFAVTFDSMSPDTSNHTVYRVVKNFNYTIGKLHMLVPMSQLYDTDYGYYEMKFRLPIPADSSQGIQTNFWGFGTGDSAVYCEIDFFEINGKDNWFTHNFHHKFDNKPGTKRASLNETTFDKYIDANGWRPQDFHYFKESEYEASQNPDGFHTVGCEVSPNKITYYFDNQFIRSAERSENNHTDHISIMQLEMNSFPKTGFYDSYWSDLKYPNNSTRIPHYWEIDYVNFYKLKCGDNNIRDIITPDNFNPTNYNHEVVKTATLGTSGLGIPNKLQGDSVVIRSEGEIRFEDGFEADVNSYFYATNCDCEE